MVATEVKIQIPGGGVLYIYEKYICQYSLCWYFLFFLEVRSRNCLDTLTQGPEEEGIELLTLDVLSHSHRHHIGVTYAGLYTTDISIQSQKYRWRVHNAQKRFQMCKYVKVLAITDGGD